MNIHRSTRYPTSKPLSTPANRPVVRFAASKPTGFAVKPVTGSTLSNGFLTQATQAQKLAMDKVDADIQGALKEQGLQFVLAEYPTQGFRSLSDIVPQKDIPRLIRLHRNTLSKILEAGSIQSVQMKEALKDDDTLTEEVFKLLKENLDRQTGIVFLEGQKAIRLSDRVVGPGASQWEHAKQDVKHLACLIRQEVARSIDLMVGRAKTGKCFSENETFQKKVLQDLQQAKKAGILTQLGTKAQSGLEFKQVLPIDGVYNKDMQFREAFATLMAAQYGGGALNLSEVQSLCPSALNYCQKEVPLSLKSWPVRAWVRFWDTLSAIGQWFRDLFSRFSGKKAK